jgi:hypothetical protein
MDKFVPDGSKVADHLGSPRIWVGGVAQGSAPPRSARG